MKEKIKVGVFSPNDPRLWVREQNIDLMIKHETCLINALKSAGVKVIRGGEDFPKMDQIAWNTKLIWEHIKKIAPENPDALIINQGSWTFPYDSIDAAKAFMSETKDIARLVIFSYKDTKVPGLVAGMAISGGLKRIGIPFVHCYGKIDKDPMVLENLMDVLKFYKKRANVAKISKKVISSLKLQKYLAFGGMSLKMPTTTSDVDQWQKLFGVSYDALDQSEIVSRALKMVRWTEKPGESEYEILDKRVGNALDFLFNKKHGKFDFSRDKLKSIHKFVYQLALYYAALDLCDEYGATFTGIKCQNELSARECTACLATAFLNNDVGADGKTKRVIPASCENDMDSALTQLLLYLLTGKPSGFGDFRDVEGDILTIANCGQHPPYFFGGPDESPIKKLNNTEYMGQEIYYDAGGSSVRGRTPGGHVMTVARLGRENLRYQLVAATIKTIDVDPKEHENYDYSWPLIRAKIPLPGEALINVWPCNHLAFAYGDLTPHLAEIGHRLDIGYRIFDVKGKKHYKPT
jgi:L-fucose isomerase-like protein